MSTRKIYIFGAGIAGSKILNRIAPFVKIAGFIDNDDKKLGRKLDDLDIFPPAIINAETDIVIVSSSKYYDEISRQLIDMGVKYVSPVASEADAIRYLYENGFVNKEALVTTLDTLNYLYEFGIIDKETYIHNYPIEDVEIEPNEEGRFYTCNYLDGFVQLQENKWMVCCKTTGGNNPISVMFSSKVSPRENVELMLRKRERIMYALNNGLPCECRGCTALHTTNQPLIQRPFRHIGIVFRTFCNIQCCYCKSRIDKRHVNLDNTNVSVFMEIMDELEKMELVDKSAILTMTATGEITVHPKQEDFITFLSNYNCRICSNCVIYSDAIVNALRLGKMIVNCSVDSGTRETYHKVKGADRFNEVKENLKLYAKAGKIELKYIVLLGVNDNEADLDGFMQLIDDIIKDAGNISSVILSKDFHNMTQLGERTITLLARFLIEIKKRTIPTNVSRDLFMAHDFNCLMNRVKELEETKSDLMHK